MITADVAIVFLASRYGSSRRGSGYWGNRLGRHRMVEVTSGSLPETDVACVQRWCAEKIPAHLRKVLRVECDLADGQLTLYES